MASAVLNAVRDKYNALKGSMENIINRRAGLVARQETLVATLKAARTESMVAAGRSDALSKALQVQESSVELLNRIARAAAESAETKVADLVTVALQGAFNDQDLSFSVEHFTYRGQPAVRFKIRDNVMSYEGEPRESFGGGLWCLIGIVLQVIAILRTPGMRRLLILDEPLSFVSHEYVVATAEVLRQLTRPVGEGNGLGFDVLVVTHHPEFANAADVRYLTSKKANKWLNVKRIK